jgi:hypothetical protein
VAIQIGRIWPVPRTTYLNAVRWSTALGLGACVVVVRILVWVKREKLAMNRINTNIVSLATDLNVVHLFAQRHPYVEEAANR